MVIYKMVRPFDVNEHNFDTIMHRMESDNYPWDNDKWSILHGGRIVSLHPPANQGAKFVEIPIEDFKEICSWFMKPQKIK